MNRVEYDEKRCTCCGAPHSQFQWRLLPLVGVADYRCTEDPEAPVLEMRNCVGFNHTRGDYCGTTLAVEVRP